jgi:hypothetical protein
MNKKPRSRQLSAKHSARLGAYLAAGIGAAAATAPTSDAAIVVIDIGPSGFNIGGINGGGFLYTSRPVNNFPFIGAGNVQLRNAYYGVTGLGGSGALEFAINGGYASPRNFALNTAIDSSATFSNFYAYIAFYLGGFNSPNFGPGSYMGFRTATNNYGWLEVTWDGTDFEILSGAYEDVAGVAILAGDTGTAAVPEPSTWAMSALLAGGVAFTVWRKRRAATQAKAQAA